VLKEGKDHDIQSCNVRETGLNFKYSTGRWGLIVKKQGGDDEWKMTE
jgi:hypothetical protein